MSIFSALNESLSQSSRVTLMAEAVNKRAKPHPHIEGELNFLETIFKGLEQDRKERVGQIQAIDTRIKKIKNTLHSLHSQLPIPANTVAMTAASAFRPYRQPNGLTATDSAVVVALPVQPELVDEAIILSSRPSFSSRHADNYQQDTVMVSSNANVAQPNDNSMRVIARDSGDFKYVRTALEDLRNQARNIARIRSTHLAEKVSIEGEIRNVTTAIEISNTNGTSKRDLQVANEKYKADKKAQENRIAELDRQIVTLKESLHVLNREIFFIHVSEHASNGMSDDSSSSSTSAGYIAISAHADQNKKRRLATNPSNLKQT